VSAEQHREEYMSDENEYIKYGRLLEVLASMAFLGLVFGILYSL